MAIVATDLRNTIDGAKRIRYEPTAPFTATNVQDAIAQAHAIPFGPTPTPVVFAQSPYTAGITDYVLLVDSTAGPVAIHLGPASARGGVPIVVKDGAGNAGVNPITVTFNGAETVDDLAPAQVIISNPFGYFKFNPKSGGYYEL